VSTSYESVDPVGDEVVQNLARAALFAALMGGFAYVSFPNPLAPGIPVTLQVLGVFLAGIMLGPVWGGFSLVVYVVAGAIGVPVFSSGAAGLGTLLGPTGGYLLSYPFAAAATGLVVHRGLAIRADVADSTATLVAGMLLGTVLIYVGGVLGLMSFGDYGLSGAIVAGVVSFLPVEAIKIAAAIGIVRSDAITAA
jgi:biotin transport system substrate-specific component